MEKLIKNSIIKKTLLVLALGSLGQFALAQADAPKTIANIVTNLNHLPSAEQKATLMAIASNKKNRAAIQTIANVVLNFQHAVTAEDKAKLSAIAADETATAAEKELAQIVANVNHTVNDEAKARLAKIK